MKEGYVGYCTDETIRKSSTSGGICQLLSRNMIKKGGLVSGVYFDKDGRLVRGISDSLESLEKFNKSKYLQADQKDIYKIIKEELKHRSVLFVGTPCQVAGLYAFLDNLENLYCVDFVCLGVTSYKVWEAYLESVGEKAAVRTIDFKDKRNGWRNFTFYLERCDGTKITEPGRSNIYMETLLKKYSVRPSCYHCMFRNLERISDITVGDAWGMEKYTPKLIDDKGTSSVMINSPKGKELIEEALGNLCLEEIEPEKLWETNVAAWKQYSAPMERKYFFKDLRKYGFLGAYRRVDRFRLIKPVYKLWKWIDVQK